MGTRDKATSAVTLADLGRRINQLESKLAGIAPSTGQWWAAEAGRFENDPVFDEIARLGRVERKKSRLVAKGERARS